MSDTVHHEGTAAVVTIIDALIEHGGWLPTVRLADRTGIHRDTVRRMCLELAAHGWVERGALEDGDRWCIGPELPRIGLAYQALLVRQAEALRSRFDTLTAPIAAPNPQEKP